MAFCTILEVRNADKKLTSDTDVPDASITERITEADNTVYTDLSPVISEAELTTIGGTSKAVNLISKYKAIELTLAKYFGAGRRVDEVSDIDYWRKKYDLLLNKILDGEIKLVSAGTEYSPTTVPIINSSANRLKVYSRKGIPGFKGPGSDGTYLDDTN